MGVRVDTADLVDLLSGIRNESIKLPEFQRSWTWDDFRIRNLIASVSQGYPIGEIMCLEYAHNDIQFQYRAIEGAPDTNQRPRQLVLDGQQRLTSMYLSTFSQDAVITKNDRGKEIKRFYYLSMEDCFDENLDRIDAVRSVPSDRILKTDFRKAVTLDLSSPEKEYKAKMFPVNIIYDAPSILKWAMGYYTFYEQEEDENKRRAARDLLDSFQREVIDKISHYELPVMTLDRDTSREAVCKIFENVNTGGIVLTVFELLTASYAMQIAPDNNRGFNLREDWERLMPEVKGTREEDRSDIFENINETTFLTTVTLYTNYRKKQTGKIKYVACKKKDVLSLDFDSYIENRNIVAHGFELARNFLMQQIYVFKKRDLPYEGQIVPLAAICALLGENGVDKNVNILTRWYWCGVLGEMYGGASETRYANDVEDIMEAVESGDISGIRTINSAFFSATRLLELQRRTSAVYKGILALFYRHGCRDFATDDPLNIMYYTNADLDIHHIFPQNYCQNRADIKIDWCNSIINKTPLLKKTNLMIGGRAPSEYVIVIREFVKNKKDVCESEAENKVRTIIETDFINYNAFVNDDFATYFIDRAKRILKLIEDAMGKPVTDKGEDATIQVYGQSLE